MTNDDLRVCSANGRMDTGRAEPYSTPPPKTVSRERAGGPIRTWAGTNADLKVVRGTCSGVCSLGLYL